MKKTPQNLKYKKYFKNKILEKHNYQFNLSYFRNFISNQSLEIGNLSPSQIEACRVSIRRKISKRKKKIKVWIKLFPYCSYTRKPVGMRMGKGKGLRAGWFAPVKKGHALYELKTKSSTFMFKLIRAYCNSWNKLSVRTKLHYNIY